MGKGLAIIAICIIVIFLLAACKVSGDESRREEE